MMFSDLIEIFQRERGCGLCRACFCLFLCPLFFFLLSSSFELISDDVTFRDLFLQIRVEEVLVLRLALGQPTSASFAAHLARKVSVRIRRHA